MPKTALRQIKDITLRPPYIRRDLWAPLVVVCNNTPETLHHTHTIFCNPGTAEPTASELKELRGKTQAQRKALRCDEIASKVEHLCRIYIYLEAKLGREAMPPLKLFWEREAFKDLVKEKGLEWPSFVSHDKLVLRKGITIKTPECLPHSTPLTLGTTSQQPVV
ncbi:hypothetical protein H4R34_004042 [Dimargaris verticillata]|uniref:Uncharacterized protein n=1 Tax=Dimargaris verticillata TaxID=2761393 RepID=A0A9W8AYY3_9FUNG|nr:hypothetical protein H4R34_004042 [Dimargaris verticillata]